MEGGVIFRLHDQANIKQESSKHRATTTAHHHHHNALDIRCDSPTHFCKVTMPQYPFDISIKTPPGRELRRG